MRWSGTSPEPDAPEPRGIVGRPPDRVPESAIPRSGPLDRLQAGAGREEFHGIPTGAGASDVGGDKPRSLTGPTVVGGIRTWRGLRAGPSSPHGGASWWS